ncbi:MAG: tripartite-type tricarboxylate transporter receptor subunit TctC [Alphaproteobacteria bacterium]|jgi:tripartite-type tricarboxylate transporter receptor subunit TctC
MKSIRKTMMVGAVALLPAVMLSTTALAADPFYKDKRITVFITSGSGGSVDLMNRLGARHVGKHIPGKPKVIAKNKTGAGGLVGANYLYNQAPKNGTELAGSLMTVPYAPLFYGKTSKAKFDPNKFNWIASPSKFVAVAIAWHTSPIKKWQDLLEKEMIVGSSGMGSASTVDSLFMRNALGLKYKVIMGYPSGGDIDLAMIRGETQGRATTAWAGVTSRHPDWITKNKVSLLYQMGLEPHPTVPKHVPLLVDEIKDPEKKALLKLKMAAYETGYPVYAPPGVPAERVALLRKAFAATSRDPEYLADAKRSRVEVNPIPGAKVAQIVADAYNAPEHLKLQLQMASRPGGKLARVKTVKASSAIKGFKKKGKVMVFEAKGKTAHARFGRRTKITIAGKKAKRGALKVGMNCVIDYYGEMGQAKSVKCK